MKYVQFFNAIRAVDVAQFGGKNSSLGEMIHGLSAQGVRVPYGFATTAQAYRAHIDENNLLPKLKAFLNEVTDYTDIDLLEKAAWRMRELIIQAPFSSEFEREIIEAYRQLSDHYKQASCDVAVRSSATAEDLPEASFAGQQETYLHVQGNDQLLQAIKRCMASLFTVRAIVYRAEHRIDHFQVALSVGVQKMVHSDRACSGILFTLDTESGFKNVVNITGSYGLGEMIVQGKINPDEFCVHKELFKRGFKSLIRKKLGNKEQKLVYAVSPQLSDSHLDRPISQGNFELLNFIQQPPLSVKEEPVAQQDRNRFCLTDEEVFELAHFGIVIEDYYSALYGRWMPMDVEWAKDGDDGMLYIVQARPETVQSRKSFDSLKTYEFTVQPTEKDVVLTGQSVGNVIASGTVRVINNLSQASLFKDGDVLVTSMTDPDWVPLMKRAAALITDQGGRMCHAAIVSRELKLPAVIGTQAATKLLQTGQQVTVDCSKGLQATVYKGLFSYHVNETKLTEISNKTPLMINIGNPENAFQSSFLPVLGVGLARLEFIITSMIKVHPMAIIAPEKITDQAVLKNIAEMSDGYSSPREYYVQTLAQSIGMIAGAFYPRPVIVRLTDFKSNEYRDLVGGSFFEPHEENPMLGFRGAVRYRNAAYAPAFELECEALRQARMIMGFDNIKIMVPFVRTVDEARDVVNLLKKEGLERGKDGLELLMMVEIPANVILLEHYAPFFDAFSIGSNDLTQLTLGVDRDSSLLSSLFDERDEAVKYMIQVAIQKAKKLNKTIGICGQAPSDFPDLARFFMQSGLDYLSLLPDSVIPYLKH